MKLLLKPSVIKFKVLFKLYMKRRPKHKTFKQKERALNFNYRLNHVFLNRTKYKVEKVGYHLTQAFSGDVNYDKIYADGFNEIFDKMISDLVVDMYEDTNNVEYTQDSIKEVMDYLIFEIAFGTDERSYSLDMKGNVIERDCTVYNAYQEIFGDLESDFDTHQTPKFTFKEAK